VIDKVGYGTATGTAAITQTTAAGAAAKQKSTLTLAAAYKENDKITIDVAGKNHIYTVTKANVSGADDAANHALIATGLAASLAADSNFSSLTTAAAGVTVTFEEKINNVSFTTSSSVSNGELGTIENLDVKTLAKSNSAIKGIDFALKNINEARAEIGSKINRLTYAADNLANVSQNTSASRSQILDTDYAQATTELARTQIISQAATAMLAQANQAPQSVLSLLR
jgi:flagellin